MCSLLPSCVASHPARYEILTFPLAAMRRALGSHEQSGGGASTTYRPPPPAGSSTARVALKVRDVSMRSPRRTGNAAC